MSGPEFYPLSGPGADGGEGAFVRTASAGHRLIIIQDPELLLPDDRLPMSKGGIEVRSQYLGGRYASVARIINRRKLVEAQLAEQTADWQWLIKPEAWVFYQTAFKLAGGGAMAVMAYGHLHDPQQFVEVETAGKVARGGVSDPEKFARRLRRRMDRALAAGWLYGQWYSESQQRGEWGSIHCSRVVSVGEESWFEEARARGWRPPETPVGSADEESVLDGLSTDSTDDAEFSDDACCHERTIDPTVTDEHCSWPETDCWVNGPKAPEPT